MIGHLISEAPLWALLLLQSTACIAAGLAVSYLLRRCPARAHHALVIAMVASVLTPAAYLLARHFDLGLLPYQPPAAERSEQPMPVFTEGTFAEAPVPEPMDFESAPIDAIAPATTPTAIVEPETDRVPWATIGLACWAACSAALFARLLLQFMLGLRLLHTSEPVQDTAIRDALRTAQARLGVRRPVAVARHAGVHSPVIWCWSRPPVLLVHHADPALPNHTDWIAVFCHELAHLKRCDHHSGLFAELLTAATPWHPLTWCARARLARLSEHACDDWVLAAGQLAADYAESLLHLSPQRRMAFLPTVIGKETTMKARIYRIVRGQCSDPRIGRRWAFGLCALAVLAIATVAMAQPQPAPLQSSEPARESEMGQRTPPQEPAVAGRRNVLERMRDQLVAQAEEAERVLRERGGEPDEETEILRAELATLRDQIGLIERQLRNLQQGPKGVRPLRPSANLPTRERPVEILDDLRNRQERIQDRLAEIDNPDSAEAQGLREELQRIHIEVQQQELTAHLRELRAQAVENQRGLKQLGDPDSEEARDRRAAQENARREMARIEGELQQLERDREAVMAERQERLRRGMEQRGNPLRRQIEEAERALREREERGQGDGDEARELREALSRMQRQMRAMENGQREAFEQRVVRDRDTSADRRPDPMTQGPPSPYGESPYGGRSSRRGRAPVQQDPYGTPPAQEPAGPDVQRQVEELRGQVNGLNEQMQQMREMLQQLLERRNEANTEPQEMKRY